MFDDGPKGKGLRPFSKEIGEMGWMDKWWAYSYWVGVRDICE